MSDAPLVLSEDSAGRAQTRADSGRRDRAGLDGRLLRDTAVLLWWQFDRWGHDCRAPGGNGLVRLGMTRTPDPGRKNNSRYSSIFDDGNWLMLWGWGLAIGDPSGTGLFLPRSLVTPVMLQPGGPPLNTWRAEDLPLPLGTCSRAEYGDRVRRWLPKAIEWIAHYEAHAAATGIAASRPAPGSRPFERSLAGQWQALVLRWAKCCGARRRRWSPPVD
jgi:hypothetical protein